ncbi:DUF1513 domain-containing protein [Pontivivens nitratireducens]|uniref:DUF1513 domain-containing protein n=1 Tax=Pontivivens nitratireducens TaxID=2758038 RepID=A0A6G7VIW1_9RHOB|nr:DUF1513 domain-containing protein [Pontibrevibacter nitratireducens]QIK40033.1 DUF1513 domain-containing protein [Pontibrevibacter nitratireducens]
MHTGRRHFVGGLLAAGLIPKPTWADVGSPAYLAAAALPDGRYALCGIDAALDVLFQIPLPGRGHAAAARPTRPEAVAFARRPGTFAIVIDCLTGRATATLTAPEGRHFYGHGAFSADGNWLFTTENDFEAGQGRIGVWDVAAGYLRVAEWSSGGIGPHDIQRLPGTDTLVVANGGIDTHPDSGRVKLNIPTMAPNLAYITDGTVQQIAALPPTLHKNSIRHLAVSTRGQVAFAMQWHGGGDVVALLGTHRRGASSPVLMDAPAEALRAMRGYVGSVAFAPDDRRVAVTSPRGGLVQVYDTQVGHLIESHAVEDASGVARARGGFAVTSGLGSFHRIGAVQQSRQWSGRYTWDNHLIAITSDSA